MQIFMRLYIWDFHQYLFTHINFGSDQTKITDSVQEIVHMLLTSHQDWSLWETDCVLCEADDDANENLNTEHKQL